jgi:hypothetical protein
MPCAIVGYPPTGGNVTILEIFPIWEIARETVHTKNKLQHPDISYELSKVSKDAKIGDVLRITPGWK